MSENAPRNVEIDAVGVGNKENNDPALEKEADVMGQKANVVGKSAEKVSEVTVAQQTGESVLQGKFSQDGLHQFSTTQPIQLTLEKSSEASDKTKRNVDDKEMKKFKEKTCDFEKHFLKFFSIPKNSRKKLVSF